MGLERCCTQEAGETMRQGVSALRRRVGASLVDRSPARGQAAWVVAIIGPAIVALGLLPIRSSVGLAGFLFCAEVAVVAVAVLGGVWPALASAAVAILLGTVLYTPPYGSLNVDVEADVGADVAALIAFVVVGAVVGFVVDELAGLAKQQAALRRVATLVARAAAADELFAAVTEEVGQQLPADFARMARYESDDSISFVATWSRTGDEFPVGIRWRLEGESVSALVWRIGRPARIDDFDDISGPLAVEARRRGIRSVVGVPIIVEGRLWGVMIAGSTVSRPLSPDAETRLAAFTDLLSTAIANAESRAELAASRARVVAAADETRRRIERDLHDGTQQRLVSLAIELRAAETRLPADVAEHRAMFSHAIEGLAQTLKDLQEISRGIHPAILSKGGLEPAIKGLARRSAVAVELDLQVEHRLPQQVEVAAYYVVSEALTNVAKYANASLVHVDVHASDSAIELAIRDDGIGGADPTRGSGLVGLKDRVEALGGTMTIASGVGKGTSVVARIPITGKPTLEAERPGATARGS
jgi:signal transduction histidine kinase